MLSAFADLGVIELGNRSIYVNPTIVDLRVSELGLDEMVRNFPSVKDVDGVFHPEAKVQLGPNYYTNAILKLPPLSTFPFHQQPNFFYFSFESSLSVWIKCQLVSDFDCAEIELVLSSLALHNLELKSGSLLKNVHISEYPVYLSSDPNFLERDLFEPAQDVTFQPTNTWPSNIAPVKIDEALREFCKSFRGPFSLNNQIIIPIKCDFDYFFSAAFKICKIGTRKSHETNESRQFILTLDSQVFLKLQPDFSTLPAKIQQSLRKSVFFPHPLLLNSYPKSLKMEEFLQKKSSSADHLATALLVGPMAGGKKTLVRRLADNLGVNVCFVNLYEQEKFTNAPRNNAFAEILAEAFKAANLVVLDGFELISMSNLKFGSIWLKIQSESPWPLRLICCHSYADSSFKKPASPIASLFDVLEVFNSGGPRKEDVEDIYRELVEFEPSISSTCVREDFVGWSVADFVGFSNRLQGGRSCSIEEFNDFKSGMKLRRSLQLNSHEIPRVKWDNVAGLDEIKRYLNNLMNAFESTPRPTGLLLHGPPGTGKTMLAKALATEGKFSLIPIKGPELLSPYIGESEAALRAVFAQARAVSPCILFFDELDALVPKRGEFGDSIGVADRLVATFMTEMDQISGLKQKSSDQADSLVFVIGATNRPDLIDSSLRRKGRFDLSIQLDGPKTIEERAAILSVSCGHLRCAAGIDFLAPFHSFKALGSASPAQIAAIASIASRVVLERKLAKYAALEEAEGDDLLIDPITTEDLIEAAKQQSAMM